MASAELWRATRLLEEANAQPCGPHRRGCLERAFEAAQAAGSRSCERRIRMELAHELIFTGHADRAVEHINWCVRESDALASPEFRAQALWRYKWLANKLCRFPEIPLTQIDAVLTDLAARFERLGWSPRVLHQLHMENAILTGRRAAAVAACVRWQGTPRPSTPGADGSDCPACEQDRLVEYHAFLPDDDHALAAAQPIIAGQLTCGEIPHLTLGRVLVPALRTRNRALADALHARGSPLVNMYGDFIKCRAQHLAYCAYTEQYERGAELLWRWIDDCIDNPDALSVFWYQRTAYLLAHAAPDVAQRVPWLRLAALLDPQCPTCDSPAEFFRAGARRRAVALDARNGNGYYVQQLQEAEEYLRTGHLPTR